MNPARIEQARRFGGDLCDVNGCRELGTLEHVTAHLAAFDGISTGGNTMTITEAADRLGVTPSTLRVQLRNGKLRGVKRGRDWWLTPSEVERYGAEHGRKVGRCSSRHPSHREARCEEEAGHPGEHFHSFYMRHWES